MAAARVTRASRALAPAVGPPVVRLAGVAQVPGPVPSAGAVGAAADGFARQTPAVATAVAAVPVLRALERAQPVREEPVGAPLARVAREVAAPGGVEARARAGRGVAHAAQVAGRAGAAVAGPRARERGQPAGLAPARRRARARLPADPVAVAHVRGIARTRDVAVAPGPPLVALADTIGGGPVHTALPAVAAPPARIAGRAGVPRPVPLRGALRAATRADGGHALPVPRTRIPAAARAFLGAGRTHVPLVARARPVPRRAVAARPVGPAGAPQRVGGAAEAAARARRPRKARARARHRVAGALAGAAHRRAARALRAPGAPPAAVGAPPCGVAGTDPGPQDPVVAQPVPRAHGAGAQARAPLSAVRPPLARRARLRRADPRAREFAGAAAVRGLAEAAAGLALPVPRARALPRGWAARAAVRPAVLRLADVAVRAGPVPVGGVVGARARPRQRVAHAPEAADLPGGLARAPERARGAGEAGLAGAAPGAPAAGPAGPVAGADAGLLVGGRRGVVALAAAPALGAVVVRLAVAAAGPRPMPRGVVVGARALAGAAVAVGARAAAIADLADDPHGALAAARLAPVPAGAGAAAAACQARRARAAPAADASRRAKAGAGPGAAGPEPPWSAGRAGDPRPARVARAGARPQRAVVARAVPRARGRVPPRALRGAPGAPEPGLAGRAVLPAPVPQRGAAVARARAVARPPLGARPVVAAGAAGPPGALPRAPRAPVPSLALVAQVPGPAPVDGGALALAPVLLRAAGAVAGAHLLGPGDGAVQRAVGPEPLPRAAAAVGPVGAAPVPGRGAVGARARPRVPPARPVPVADPAALRDAGARRARGAPRRRVAGAGPVPGRAVAAAAAATAGGLGAAAARDGARRPGPADVAAARPRPGVAPPPQRAVAVPVTGERALPVARGAQVPVVARARPEPLGARIAHAVARAHPRCPETRTGAAAAGAPVPGRTLQRAAAAGPARVAAVAGAAPAAALGARAVPRADAAGGARGAREVAGGAGVAREALAAVEPVPEPGGRGAVAQARPVAAAAAVAAAHPPGVALHFAPGPRAPGLAGALPRPLRPVGADAAVAADVAGVPGARLPALGAVHMGRAGVAQRAPPVPRGGGVGAVAGPAGGARPVAGADRGGGADGARDPARRADVPRRARARPGAEAALLADPVAVAGAGAAARARLRAPQPPMPRGALVAGVARPVPGLPPGLAVALRPPAHAVPGARQALHDFARLREAERQGLRRGLAVDLQRHREACAGALVPAADDGRGGPGHLGTRRGPDGQHSAGTGPPEVEALKREGDGRVVWAPGDVLPGARGLVAPGDARDDGPRPVRQQDGVPRLLPVDGDGDREAGTLTGVALAHEGRAARDCLRVARARGAADPQRDGEPEEVVAAHGDGLAAVGEAVGGVQGALRGAALDAGDDGPLGERDPQERVREGEARPRRDGHPQRLRRRARQHVRVRVEQRPVRAAAEDRVRRRGVVRDVRALGAPPAAPGELHPSPVAPEVGAADGDGDRAGGRAAHRHREEVVAAGHRVHLQGRDQGELREMRRPALHQRRVRAQRHALPDRDGGVLRPVPAPQVRCGGGAARGVGVAVPALLRVAPGRGAVPRPRRREPHRERRRQVVERELDAVPEDAEGLQRVAAGGRGREGAPQDVVHRRIGDALHVRREGRVDADRAPPAPHGLPPRLRLQGLGERAARGDGDAGALVGDGGEGRRVPQQRVLDARQRAPDVQPRGRGGRLEGQDVAEGVQEGPQQRRRDPPGGGERDHRLRDGARRARHRLRHRGDEAVEDPGEARLADRVGR